MQNKPMFCTEQTLQQAPPACFIFGPKATVLNTYASCGRMQRRATPSFNGWDFTRGE